MQDASERLLSSMPTILKALLRERHLQNYGMFKRAYQKAARGLDKDLAETYPSVQTFRRWLAGQIKTLPHAEHCAVLEAMLPGWTVADLFRPYFSPGDTAGSTLLQQLLRRRCIHDYRAFCRAYNIAATTIDKSLAGTYPAEPQFYRWISGDMIGLPYPHHCNVLEVMFPGYCARQLFEPHHDDSSPMSGGTGTATGDDVLDSFLPAAASNGTQPQPTQTNPSHDAGRLLVPTGHEATASSTKSDGQTQAERITGVLAPYAFLASAAAEMPAEEDNEIRDQLANLFRRWVGRMNRRELIQLLGWAVTTISASPVVSGLNIDEQQRLARAISSPSRVDAQVIDHIETMHRYCKRQDDALGSRAALPIALAQRNLVDGLLSECPTVLQSRLLSVYSDMLTSVGYYFFDLNDFDSARHYCDQARVAAHDAGNAELGIYALSEMSYIASAQNKVPATIDLAAAAQSLASKAEDLPLMRIYATQAAATAYAVDGQYRECMVECEKAEDGLASIGQVPELGYFLNEGYLARMKSECLLRLGKPQEAAASASAGLMLYDKSFADGYTQCTLHLGNAHLQSGEINEAAHVVGDAAGLAVQTHSPRLIKEIHETRARLQPWRDTRAVKELDDRLAAYGLASNLTAL